MDEAGLKASSVILTCYSFKPGIRLAAFPRLPKCPFSSGIPPLKMISEMIKEHSKNMRCAIIIKPLSLSIHLSTQNGKKNLVNVYSDLGNRMTHFLLSLICLEADDS